MTVERDRLSGARDLLRLLADAANVVEGTIGSGAGLGATVSFTYRNPISGETLTTTGVTVTECPPPNITALRSSDGNWYVMGRDAARQTQARLLDLRRKRPVDDISNQVLVGYLYAQLLHQESPVLCGPNDPNAQQPPDPDDDLPPRDPDYPHADRYYTKTWADPFFTQYPDEVERWLFGQDNCSLNYSASTSADSLGWLPDFPVDPFYQGIFVSQYLTYVHTLYEQPNTSSKTWTGYQQLLLKQIGSNFVIFASIAGVVQTFKGDSAPDQPPTLYVYLGPTAAMTPFNAGRTYRVVGDTAQKKCAPRLPPAPQPPAPPPLPPNPADRKSYAIWFTASNLEKPLKLKTLSEQETRGKGDIVFLSPSKTLVILKYGNARNDGAPNNIDRGYCRLAIFEIPGPNDEPFKETSMTWSVAQAGGALSALLELGLGEHLFFQHLASLSFYADDTSGILGGQTNPLYDRWIKADTLQVSLKTFGSRHFRNLTKTTPYSVYISDPFPEDTNPNAKDWRGEAMYTQAPLAELKTKGKVTLPMKALGVFPNQQFNHDQPESDSNRAYDYLPRPELEINKLELTLALAADESLITIVYAPIDPRSLR